MSRKKIFLPCLMILLLSIVSLLIIGVGLDYIYAKASSPMLPVWVSAMEFVTPVLMTGLVIILHTYAHKYSK